VFILLQSETEFSLLFNPEWVHRDWSLSLSSSTRVKGSSYKNTRKQIQKQTKGNGFSSGSLQVSDDTSTWGNYVRVTLFPMHWLLAGIKWGILGEADYPKELLVQPIITIFILCSFYTNIYIHHMHKFCEMKPSFHLVPPASQTEI